MIVIRTTKELAHALASSLDTSVLVSLAAHRERLLVYEDYALDDLVLFLIVRPGDALNSLNSATGAPLVQDGSFTFPAECIDRQGDWLEVLFVLSDDGFGVVLFVPLMPQPDPIWMSALEAVAPNGSLPMAG